MFFFRNSSDRSYGQLNQTERNLHSIGCMASYRRVTHSSFDCIQGCRIRGLWKHTPPPRFRKNITSSLITLKCLFTVSSRYSIEINALILKQKNFLRSELWLLSYDISKSWNSGFFVKNDVTFGRRPRVSYTEAL